MNEIINLLIYSAVNFIDIYVLIRFLDLFLESGMKNKKLRYTAILLYWFISNTQYFYINNLMFNLLFVLSLTLAFALIIYRQSLWKKVIAVISVLAIRMTIESFFSFLLFIKQTSVTEELRFYNISFDNSHMYLLFTVMLFFIIELAFEKYFLFGENGLLPKSSYLHMAVMPIGSIILNIILLLQTTDNPLLTAAGLVTVFAINLLSFFLYDRTFASYNERYLLEQKILMYENQFEIIRQSQDNIRSLRHDIKRHLHLISAYARDGKTEAIEDYIAAIAPAMRADGEIAQTGNDKIDAIINYMLEKSRKMGTELTVKINVPNTEFCPVFDLNVLLGNLLENALEALESCSDKKLSLTMKYNKNILYLETANSFQAPPNHTGRQYLTTKADRHNHGIGLKNIQAIVDKYDGTLKVSHSDNMFYVNIILFVNKQV